MAHIVPVGLESSGSHCSGRTGEQWLTLFLPIELGKQWLTSFLPVGLESGGSHCSGGTGEQWLALFGGTGEQWLALFRWDWRAVARTVPVGLELSLIHI